MRIVCEGGFDLLDRIITLNEGYTIKEFYLNQLELLQLYDHLYPGRTYVFALYGQSHFQDDLSKLHDNLLNGRIQMSYRNIPVKAER